MACVTNKPEHLAQGILDILQLSPYFKMVVGGDSLAERKPHPLPLLHCIQQQNITASQTLMIGDSVMMWKPPDVQVLIVLWSAMAIIMGKVSMTVSHSKWSIVWQN